MTLTATNTLKISYKVQPIMLRKRIIICSVFQCPLLFKTRFKFIRALAVNSKRAETVVSTQWKFTYAPFTAPHLNGTRTRTLILSAFRTGSLIPQDCNLASIISAPVSCFTVRYTARDRCWFTYKATYHNHVVLMFVECRCSFKCTHCNMFLRKKYPQKA